MGAVRLYGPAALGSSAATIYTALTGAQIRLGRVSNPTGGAVTFTLSIGADAASKRIYVKSIPAGGSLNFRGPFNLAVGDILQASGNGLILEISGNDETAIVFKDAFSTGSAPSNDYRSWYPLSAAINATLSPTYQANMTTDPNYGVPDDQEGGITSASSTISGGALHIAATNQACVIGGVNKTATRGLVRTAAAYLYGYFEVECKIAAGQGFWPAFWLWPPNPLDLSDWQEIDMFEAPSTGASGIYSNVHYGPSGAPQQTGPFFLPGDFSTAFHKFAVLWLPDQIRFYVDNSEFSAAALTDPSKIPSVPLCVHMDFQVGGTWPGNTNGTTPWPGDTQFRNLKVAQSK